MGTTIFRVNSHAAILDDSLDRMATCTNIERIEIVHRTLPFEKSNIYGGVHPDQKRPESIVVRPQSGLEIYWLRLK
ncbi:MAG: hypothetical protein V3U69_06000 [Bacteroidota bacterium]